MKPSLKQRRETRYRDEGNGRARRVGALRRDGNPVRIWRPGGQGGRHHQLADVLGVALEVFRPQRIGVCDPVPPDSVWDVDRDEILHGIAGYG